ncbi:hypothetical protein BSY240_1588 [Agrobacterium sp. RAC06]|nr:hypothetical protein BSY240_1588 [Agrobacterium sp. RAC06]
MSLRLAPSVRCADISPTGGESGGCGSAGVFRSPPVWGRWPPFDKLRRPEGVPSGTRPASVPGNPQKLRIQRMQEALGNLIADPQIMRPVA